MRACKQDFTVYKISKWREADHLAFFKEQGFEQGTATVPVFSESGRLEPWSSGIQVSSTSHLAQEVLLRIISPGSPNSAPLTDQNM